MMNLEEIKDLKLAHNGHLGFSRKWTSQQENTSSNVHSQQDP
ncbi:hypothetical protein SAMN05661044_01073 [Olivibacter domesticus]|uniref:Uncharacterized protein n=1 Tax=Olivibacter domesticus TaxID=407022 RepID=A0A1H7JRA5_OLID1|nr:hypothetical protein SAMN05661044_01073 [Olivibacter domesticus]